MKNLVYFTVHSPINVEKEKGGMLQVVTSEKYYPIELFWEDITVTATIKERKYRHLPCCHKISEKIILDTCTGLARPGTFTAIMGPSGKELFIDF